MRKGQMVFIGGSRRISRLNEDVRSRLDNLMENGLTVAVGDANGADKAVQKYLADKGYRQVNVFCMVGTCRNNVGRWLTREIDPPPGARGFEFFSAKDRVMAEEADYGLMLWDGKSRGTLANVNDMVSKGKPVVLYLTPSKAFMTLRSPDQVYKIAAGTLQSGHRTLAGGARP